MALQEPAKRSSKFVHMKIVAEPGVARTAEKLDNPPSKVRPLWQVKVVAS